MPKKNALVKKNLTIFTTPQTIGKHFINLQRFTCFHEDKETEYVWGMYLINGSEKIIHDLFSADLEDLLKQADEKISSSRATAQEIESQPWSLLMLKVNDKRNHCVSLEESELITATKFFTQSKSITNFYVNGAACAVTHYQHAL